MGYATRDGEIRLIELPDATLGELRNYIGSVAASADGGLIGVSSPEGSTILAIDPDTATVVASLGLENGCGIAPDTVARAAAAGANVLVAGSALFRDPAGLAHAVADLRDRASAEGSASSSAASRTRNDAGQSEP